VAMINVRGEYLENEVDAPKSKEVKLPSCQVGRSLVVVDCFGFLIVWFSFQIKHLHVD
jgi:hypothetical protein